MLRRMRWYLWVLLGFLLVYTGVSVYFMERFFPGTQINGIDASFLTPGEISSLTLEQAKDYELVLEERGGRKTSLKPETFGTRFYETEAAQQAKRSQNGFLWPRMFWKKDNFQILPGVQIDEKGLSSMVERLSCVRIGREPRDAWVELKSDSYEIHREDPGSRIDPKVLEACILEAVSKLLPSVDLEEAGCYREPTIRQDSPEVVNLTKKLDRWLGARIVYEFGPETEVVDREALCSFIEVEGYEASLKPEAVAEWIDALAEKRDTYKRPRRFKSTRRGEIQVKGTSFGWEIDRKTEAEALLSCVEQGETLTKEPAYLHRGNPWSANGDIGDTYVEVDISAQHLWLYQEGKLIIETDVVTGNMSRGYGTPAMVAAIKYKARNAVLRGANYASPVKYWMPFHGNYGLHDANWRKSFGGDIYKTEGSHGCVNIPPANAKIIFENVEKGTPVVLYY